VPRSPRRWLARAAGICALLAVLLVATAGCSSATHRHISQALCLYNVDRAFHDARHHHLIFGALNVAGAVHNCERGFGKNAR
jgi:hypothetical protein